MRHIYIYQIQRLQYLDLSACSGLESLPKRPFIWYQSLRHLDLAGCSGLKALPVSFERLAGVLRLDLSGCSELKALPDWGDIHSGGHGAIRGHGDWSIWTCRRAPGWSPYPMSCSAGSGGLGIWGYSGLKALPGSYERLSGVLRHAPRPFTLLRSRAPAQLAGSVQRAGPVGAVGDNIVSQQVVGQIGASEPVGLRARG